ncbi:sugar kinase [Acuticoccus sp. M5D2P5]|uniref:N-acetylglucosamine kinase n=1 Tax=Acuticoccus kalidii TaxID=2910977 RepID=UPI001F3CF984|nr:BadF/BadG/BcrA/BcrD ATPase family protein [Acuticoccus kalidii]MCF3932098.1 sugar kinase [Acuticoccus kalidii]
MEQSGATRPLIVGIDIGGTKTHLRAIGPDGERDLVVPSVEWRCREWGEDAARLLAMVDRFVEAAPVAAIGVGAHGCDDGAECEAFLAAFVERTRTPISVVNDAELMPLALGLHGQIGVVAGTGSIAVCRKAGGEMMVAGGWGWIIGDEGSAASLVREAARAAAQHFDAGGSRDEPLVELLFDGLEVPHVPRLGSVLAALGSATAVGRHAEIVFQAADRGSELAHRVIREGGAALAMLVRHLQTRGAPADTVVAGGSVIVAQPLLWQAFADAVTVTCEGAIVPRLFSGKPVEGACHLAASLIAPSTGTAGTGGVRQGLRI